VRKFLFILFAPVMFLPSFATSDNNEPSVLPDWINTVFKWYAQNLISESELTGALAYLTGEGIIKISDCRGTALCIKEKVKRIVDGDTLYTDTYKVRISLTDTPELGENGYFAASDFTRNLCPVGSTVIIDQDDLQPYDVYGRLLGKVICDEKILNSELLDIGLATLSTKYCQTSEFSIESWAKKFGC